jgi:hypothetical protein
MCRAPKLPVRTPALNMRLFADIGWLGTPSGSARRTAAAESMCTAEGAGAELLRRASWTAGRHIMIRQHNYPMRPRRNVIRRRVPVVTRIGLVSV